MTKGNDAHLADDEPYEVGSGIFDERVLKADVRMAAEIDAHAIVAHRVVLRVTGMKADAAGQLEAGGIVLDDETILLHFLRLPATYHVVLLLLCVAGGKLFLL